MKIKVGDTVEIVSLVEMCGPSDLKLRGRPNGREVGIMYVRDCATVLERKNVEGLVWCKLRTEHTQQEGWCLQLDLRRLDKKELEWKLERLNRPLARAGDVLKVRTRTYNFKLRRFPDTLENALVPNWYEDFEAHRQRAWYLADDDKLALVLESLRVPLTVGRSSDVDCHVFLLEDGTSGWIDAGYLVPKDMG